MSESKHTRAWIYRIQDARIEIRKRLFDLEGEALGLAEHAGKLEATNAALLEALEALTDPEGHIYHGPNTPPGGCTGECRAARAALAKARGETP